MPSPEERIPPPSRTYSIIDKDGSALAVEVLEPEAHDRAQRMANALGESVRLRATGTGDTIEVAPSVLP
jgi:hypothetical protein